MAVLRWDVCACLFSLLHFHRVRIKTVGVYRARTDVQYVSMIDHLRVAVITKISLMLVPQGSMLTMIKQFCVCIDEFVAQY